ncbi:universal stress protein [Dactylosporangium sp. CA-139066]|uniref:universal stress protein n=1 Tax=Dactylosporangium sp. CA-139066 TaxID=3239930 RepID=UPI003D91C626
MNRATAVVVGVDGSPESLAAVDWAAGDAGRRGCRLRVVHALQWPAGLYAPLGAPVPPLYETTVREATQRILDEAVARARAAAPGIEVATDLPVGHPAAALLEESRQAVAVVVGSRGLGGFTGLLLGSVGAELAGHAACPLVVVRHTVRPAGPEAGRVIVGIDGSHDARSALRFAFEQASYRGCAVTAVHAYQWPPTTGPGEMLPLVYDPAQLRDEERLAVAESMSGWGEQYPDVDVRQTVVRGRPAAVLTELSAGAELLVVGSRGRGGFTGLLLGSVSQAAVHHAACPVVVAR